MEDNINHIANEIKTVISQFMKEHFEPCQKTLLDLTERISGLEKENSALLEEIQKYKHFNELLAEKTKTLQEEISSMNSVSIIRSWEKKVIQKDMELTQLKTKYDKLEMTVKDLNNVNTFLNTELEKKRGNLVIGDKRIITNSLEENASSSTKVELSESVSHETQTPTTSEQLMPVVEQPVPVVEPTVSVVEHSVPAVEETRYVVKKIKGVKYIIDEENNLFSMDDNGNPKEVVGKKLDKGYKFFV
jgi:predicted nuclease with TOPRIM domain